MPLLLVQDAAHEASAIGAFEDAEDAVDGADVCADVEGEGEGSGHRLRGFISLSAGMETRLKVLITSWELGPLYRGCSTLFWGVAGSFFFFCKLHFSLLLQFTKTIDSLTPIFDFVI